MERQVHYYYYRSMNQEPCTNFFIEKQCRHGDDCFYSHDPELFKALYSLTSCPTEGCNNFCRGQQCKACHLKMKNKLKSQTNK